MNLDKQINFAFAESLVNIDYYIVSKARFDFDLYIDDVDSVLDFALSFGDVVPEFMVSVIDNALTELGCNAGLYKRRYLSAVDYYNSCLCVVGVDSACCPDYIAGKSEQLFFNNC